MRHRLERAEPSKKIDPALIGAALLLACLTTALGIALWTLPFERPGLREEVVANLAKSGVESPVTAVLLNFRGYDTLLEVMVLLLAVMAVWSFGHATFNGTTMNTSPVQTTAIHLLTPMMLLTAAYLVWQGSRFAGGAFQGGAVLAGAGVFLLVGDLPWLKTIPSRPLRLGLAMGPAVFLAVTFLCLMMNSGLLRYPDDTAGIFLLIIEVFCALSIGLTLAALFAGGRPLDDPLEKQTSSNEKEERID